MFQILKGYDSESKTFRIPIDLIRELEILAAQNKLSLNALVVQCLDYALTDIKQQEQQEQKKKQREEYERRQRQKNEYENRPVPIDGFRMQPPGSLAKPNSAPFHDLL